VEINFLKSGLIRTEGSWLKPISFLGVEFDALKGTLTNKKGEVMKLEDVLTNLGNFKKFLGHNLYTSSVRTEWD